ncbi:MAG: N-acetyltransferase [Candidatus Aenigmatarchaeota archaeon]|nr:MAG: N-acetyltransferase [Candidatus Aenigmarchaeota archaeon]
MKAFVHETATVERGSRVGRGTKVWHDAQVREGAVIGKDCNLGHCAYVDQGVRIGDRVKIGNKVSIFKGVSVEDDVMIAPHAVFTNDIRPRSRGDWKLIKTHVEKGATIGSNSTIVCGITIGAHSMIGAGSVVTRDVPEHGLVFGNPARLKGFVCACGENLEKASEKGDSLAMKCSKCSEQVSVSKKDYEKLGSGVNG